MPVLNLFRLSEFLRFHSGRKKEEINTAKFGENLRWFSNTLLSPLLTETHCVQFRNGNVEGSRVKVLRAKYSIDHQGTQKLASTFRMQTKVLLFLQEQVNTVCLEMNSTFIQFQAGKISSFGLSRQRVRNIPKHTGKRLCNSLSLSLAEKPGHCPYMDPLFPVLGPCQSNCGTDSDCSDTLKCCKTGCGALRCSNPEV